MSDQVKTVSEQNIELKQELWERGYYVQEVGQVHTGELDYLIVTCAKPKDAKPIDHNAN